MYYTFRSLPEFANLSKQERRFLLRACIGKPFRQLKVWCYLIPLSALMLVLNCFPFFAVIYHVKINPTLFILFPIISVLCTIAGVSFITIFILIPELRPHLRAQRGGFCLHCGYDLRASPTRCPECGTPSQS